MYDQHVHRAMVLIERDELEEIPAGSAEKVQSYLHQYLPFHKRFQNINTRSLDRALWSYGKFEKGGRFLLPEHAAQ
jgi:hypothetical protein